MATSYLKFPNVNNFLAEVKKFSINNDDTNILSFISNIDWDFINTANDSDIDSFISEFSDLLIKFKRNTAMVPKLCETLMKYLYASPNNAMNYKPLLILIWNLYYSNSSIKEELKLAMSNMFPHFKAAKLELVTGYVENLLDLVTLHNLDSMSSCVKYTECNVFFIKDNQLFILEKIVDYVIYFDVCLLMDSQLAELPAEFNIHLPKLDKIMCLLFNFINKNSHDTNGQFNWHKAEELFKKIKRVYKNKILIYNMQKSLFHVHYFLAYMTSLHTGLSKHMCEYLWTLATDTYLEIDVRCAAARNLAGYVSKFNFINSGLALVIISDMFAWCNSYLDQSTVVADDLTGKHQIFYCIANAAIYILLHRHKEMIDYFGSVSNFSAYADSWQLSYLTMHKVNVLKEYPFRDQLPRLCTLFRNCFLGFIDTIVEEKVLRTTKPTLLIGIPFRYYFLANSMKMLEKHRVSSENHSCLD